MLYENYYIIFTSELHVVGIRVEHELITPFHVNNKR